MKGFVVFAIFFYVISCEASVIDLRSRKFTIKEPFVVGGEETTIEEYPHQLGLLDLSRGGYICGASNIAPRYALSAAHCLDRNVAPELINLWGGSTSRLTGGRIFFVDRYINHPDYDRQTIESDISILVVSADTPLSGVPNVSPVPLPPVCNSDCCGTCVAGNDVVVAGWGVYNIDTRQLPENLQRLYKAIFDQTECARVWLEDKENFSIVITPRMFCTVAENGKDSCNGDSGSAVLRDGVQHGVVSFGSVVCGDGSAPAVYVRIENPVVRNWITQHTGL